MSSPEKPAACEFEPPLACVRRILKRTLSSNTNVGKDASAAFARASGIFIIYITACANDFAREHKRQTITANDVLAAIKELDFEEFVPEMMQFLESYRISEKSKRDAKAKAAADRKQRLTSGDEEKDVANELALNNNSPVTTPVKNGEDDDEDDEEEDIEEEDDDDDEEDIDIEEEDDDDDDTSQNKRLLAGNNDDDDDSTQNKRPSNDDDDDDDDDDNTSFGQNKRLKTE